MDNVGTCFIGVFTAFMVPVCAESWYGAIRLSRYVLGEKDLRKKPRREKGN